MNFPSYEGYDSWKAWSPHDFGKCDPALAYYYRCELKKSGVEAVAGKRILELGFGNGSFAGWANVNGASYVGTETIPTLVQVALAQGFEVHRADQMGNAMPSPGALDIAVAFDVFEHIPLVELGDLLRTIYIALRSGGKVIGRVPSGDSPFARAIQHGDLTHRLALGSSALRQLAAEVGFEVESIREPAFPLRGAGIASFMSRLAVGTVRTLVYPVLRHAFMGGGTPVLTPNLVFVLRKS